jgi:type III pantothenate kinase
MDSKRQWPAGKNRVGGYPALERPDVKNLLAVDVGNTSVHFTYYVKSRRRQDFRIATRVLETKAATILKKKYGKRKNLDVVIGSVVPKAGNVLKRIILRILNIRARMIGPQFAVPIVNKYRKPGQVGVDRLLSALAAFHEHKKALIVIDFGTAITFDIVSRKGEYLGGVIAPGIEISLEALFQKTALLPKIRLRHPKNLIGKDTIESICVGCSVGIGGLCDRIVERLEKRYRFRAKVIATGGYAKFMSRYCQAISQIDPHLISKGIELTYRHHMQM